MIPEKLHCLQILKQIKEDFDIIIGQEIDMLQRFSGNNKTERMKRHAYGQRSMMTNISFLKKH